MVSKQLRLLRGPVGDPPTGYSMSQSKTAVPHVKHYIGCPIRIGVGPSTFFLHIYDMYRSPNQMRFVPFADDTTMFASDSDINNVHGTANRELVGVDDWLKANRLSRNVSKTSYMIISKEKNVIELEFEIQFLQNFKQSNSLALQLIKILLLLTDHVKNVTTKICKCVGVMRRLHC